jgi:hypothetical protein
MPAVEHNPVNDAVQTPFVGPEIPPTVAEIARRKAEMLPAIGALPPIELKFIVVAVVETTVAVPPLPKLPAPAVAEITVPAGIPAGTVIPVMLPFQEPFA